MFNYILHHSFWIQHLISLHLHRTYLMTFTKTTMHSSVYWLKLSFDCMPQQLFNLWSKFLFPFTNRWRSGCALQYRWWMGHLQYLVIWCVQLLGFKIQEIHFEIFFQCSPLWRICQRNRLQSCIGSLQLTNHFNCMAWPPELAHCGKEMRKSQNTNFALIIKLSSNVA